MYAKLTLSDLSKDVCMDLVKSALKGQNPMTIGVKSKTICINDVKTAETDRVTSIIPMVFKSLEELQILGSAEDNPKKRRARANPSDEANESTPAKGVKKASEDYEKAFNEHLAGPFEEIAKKSSSADERFESFIQLLGDTVPELKISSHAKELMNMILVKIPSAVNNEEDITSSCITRATSKNDWNYFCRYVRNFVKNMQIVDDDTKHFRTIEFVKYYHSKLNVGAET